MIGEEFFQVVKWKQQQGGNVWVCMQYIIVQNLRFSMLQRGKSTSSMGNFRKWQKVIEPIVKYSRSSSPLSYPLDFFYELEQILANGHPLSLNIATTLTGAKDNCIKTVFQGDQPIGRVTFTAGILKSSFDGEVEKEWQQRLARLAEKDGQFQAFLRSLRENNALEQILPCALIKEKSVQQGGAVDYRVLTLSRDEYKKLVNLQANQVAQCFVWGSGKQASVIRFFHFPQKQNSQAFKIDNQEGFMKRRFGKGQFKVRQSQHNSLTFVKIMFTNKSFYPQTQALVSFLEKHLNIAVDKIVTDWVLDPHGRYFLIDLKELRFKNKPQPVRVTRSLTDALAFLTCAVCQQKFRSDQITKTLTDKLIGQFFQHLRKRQISLSFSPLHHRSKDVSRLCDLCYMLVVSEAELTELERSIALATHSLATDPQPPPHWARTTQAGEMYEWRLFLYLEDIRELTLGQPCEKGFFVMMRLHNSITAFQLQSNSSYCLVKGIKVHYLFSESTKIQKFLANSQITVRITRGQNWNAVVAEGSTSGLYQQSEKYSMRKFKQILVFDAQSRYSVIGMHIGLRMEGRYDPRQLSLMKFHDVYMVDNYSNCYSLPAEWMETIDPTYCITKSQTASFNYGLHLSPAEKRTLLPTLTSKRKKLQL